MICPKCGKEIETNFCPFCGFEFTNENIEKIVENYKENFKDNISNTEINRNIFSFKGRISKNDYAKVLFVAYIINIVVYFINRLENLNSEALPVAIYNITHIISCLALLVILFATSKRLRDIGWNQLFMLFLFVPLFGLILQIPLLIIGKKD